MAAFQTSHVRAKQSKEQVLDLLEQALKISFPTTDVTRVTRIGNTLRVRFPQVDIGPHYVSVTIKAEA